MALDLVPRQERLGPTGRRRWHRLSMSLAGVLLISCSGGSLPSARSYADGLSSARIDEICGRLRIGNFYDLKLIRSDLRDAGATDEAAIDERASEILTYVKDEKC